MSLHHLTNVYEGNATDTIAINSEYVVSVYETLYPDPNTNELIPVTNIFTTNNITYQVKESYLDVVSKFNSDY